MVLKEQIPLIQIVDSDDEILRQDKNINQWYHVLTAFPWRLYRNLAAAYYDALYAFNLNQKAKEKHNAMDSTNDESDEDETKEHARQRLLFERATLDPNAAILYAAPSAPSTVSTVDPLFLAPGIVPDRLVGKKPKCFFALFKAFLGAALMGFAAEPEYVHKLLISNLSFARSCGFVPKTADAHYWHRHVPSLRKLEQFDQIMTQYNLWSWQKWEEVRQNIESGVIHLETELVGDTTHYYAYSSFETVTYLDEKGCLQKKSQSKVTKRCGCEDKNECSHPWELADEGAGTIVKSTKKMFWGHKASIVGLPQQGIPLDVAAVSDASTHDSRTLVPHLERVFAHLPELQPQVKRVLYDSACDGEELKKTVKEQFNIELKASLNPRGKKDVTEGLPRGMSLLTPYGEVICQAGHSMEFQGIRFATERFIYGPPAMDSQDTPCLSCADKAQCCPHAIQGRMVTIPFALLPHINPEDPPCAKRFKAIMTRRPAVERMIKRLKRDLSDDRLTKRGNASFQASLDKTMIAFHVQLRQE